MTDDRRWTDRHPRVWASRHVAANLLGTAAAVLGIGFALPRLLDLTLPDLTVPAWVRLLDPGHWLAPLLSRLPDLPALPDLPDWHLGWVKYVVGFLLAVAVAVREVRRRRDRR